MFNIESLSSKIDGLLPNSVDIDTFADWFLSASWGHYDVQGDPISEVISAITYLLLCYESHEIKEDQVVIELAKIVNPFKVKEPIG